MSRRRRASEDAIGEACEEGGGVSDVVVVEDDADMREMIRLTLMGERSMEVCGEATNALDAVETARRTQPNLIILDHSIEGDVMGLEAAPMLKAVAPGAKILLFSAFDLEAEADAEPSIDAYLRKDAIRDLLPMVRRLLAVA